MNRLQEVQNLVDNTWKGSRWIMDVLSYARDKACPPGSLSASVVLARHRSTAITADTSAFIPTMAPSLLTSSVAPYHSPEAAARQLAAGLMMQRSTSSGVNGGKSDGGKPPALPPKPATISADLVSMAAAPPPPSGNPIQLVASAASIMVNKCIFFSAKRPEAPGIPGLISCRKMKHKSFPTFLLDHSIAI